jgi:hypothetical protein
VDTLAALRRRFVSRLAGRVFVRFHMGLIFAGTVAAGVATSRLLYLADVDALMVRYALAVAGSYLTFFLLVRAWIVYVTRGGPSDLGADLPDVWPGGGGDGAHRLPSRRAAGTSAAAAPVAPLMSHRCSARSPRLAGQWRRGRQQWWRQRMVARSG